MNRDKLLKTLREKVDTCYQAYMANMVSKGPQVVFENAGAIHFNQQAYEMLHSDDHLDIALLELLNQAEDPLRIAREEWENWHDIILLDEVDNAVEFALSLENYFRQEGQLDLDDPDYNTDEGVVTEQNQQL